MKNFLIVCFAMVMMSTALNNTGPGAASSSPTLSGLTVTGSTSLQATTATTGSFSSSITSTAASGNSLQSNSSTYPLQLGSAMNDATASASVAPFTLIPANAYSANDLVLRVCESTGTNCFTMDQEGDIKAAGIVSTREFLVDKVSSGIGAGNLLTAGVNYSGFKMAQAWTLTHLSINVTTASSATAANTVLTSTDGTNTCTFTFACNTVTNTTGVKDVAGVNGAGTGCVYAAAASVTWSVTTQGCATAVTTNAMGLWGKPQ